MGVHTGMRHEGWSIQANERLVLAPGPKIGFEKGILLDTINAFLEGHQPIGKTLRAVLTNASTLEEAIPLLEHTPLASPAYLIVGGLDNGIVITRDRNGVATKSQDTSPFFMGHEPVPPGAAAERVLPHWFLATTNYDPWVTMTNATCESEIAGWTPLKQRECKEYIMAVYADNHSCADFCQLYSDGRAETAKAQMNALGGSDNVTPEGLFHVMSTPDVLNPTTRFTTLMSPASGMYNTTVRVAAATNATSNWAPRSRMQAQDLRFLVRSMVTSIPQL